MGKRGGLFPLNFFHIFLSRLRRWMAGLFLKSWNLIRVPYWCWVIILSTLGGGLGRPQFINPKPPIPNQ